MLKIIQQLFEEVSQTQAEPLNEHGKSLAGCALMVEIATIDEHFCEQELATLSTELQRQFSISDEELASLIELARREQKEAAGMYSFTKVVNEQFTAKEKFELLVGLWKVAFADGQLDKYEEYMIRKLSDLLHIGQSQFIRAKKKAQNNSES